MSSVTVYTVQSEVEELRKEVAKLRTLLALVKGKLDSHILDSISRGEDDEVEAYAQN